MNGPQAMIIEIEVMIVEIIEIKVMTVEIEAMIVEIEAKGGFTPKEKVIEKDLEVQGTALIQIRGQIIVISVGRNPQHRQQGRNQSNPALGLLCLGQVPILVLMIPCNYLRNLQWPAR